MFDSVESEQIEAYEFTSFQQLEQITKAMEFCLSDDGGVLEIRKDDMIIKEMNFRSWLYYLNPAESEIDCTNNTDWVIEDGQIYMRMAVVIWLKPGHQLVVPDPDDYYAEIELGVRYHDGVFEIE